MNHFLITRFNVKFPDYKESKDNSLVQTEYWLKDRIELFKKYCLPSVVNQNNKRFHWLIFLDVDTLDQYKRETLNLLEPYPHFHPVFIDQLNELIPLTQSFIKEHSTADYIITTRLDNDDILHKDFIKTIQQLATNKEQVIDLRNGFQFDITKDVSEFRDYSHAFNPFISLVEPKKHLKTVFSKMHHDWEKSKNITVYTKKRLWVEVVHQKNLVNYSRPYPLTRRINIENFGLKNISKQRGVFYIYQRYFYKRYCYKAMQLKNKILRFN